ncbi:MAG: hypothetical protein H6668_08150 [Ardenticatenaceae bacterium]|nr:hypothetical protein [Ardenticatenaceae bacterium]
MSVIDYFGNNLVFRSRPEAISADFRPLWRMAVVLLILRLASYGNRSTLSRLHVLNWAIHSEKNKDNIRIIISGDLPPDKIMVRIEPSLIRAIELTKGEGLIEYTRGKGIKLTQKGVEAANKVVSEPNLLSEEKLFLQEIGKRKLTEQLINKMFSEEFR